MHLSAFASLPDESRLWLIALASPAEQDRLAPEMEALLGRWRHKGTQYHAAWTLIEQRILAVAEPTLATQPSGCAIDGMLRGITQVAARLGLPPEDPQAVLFRLPGGVVAIPRTDLADRLADGTLQADTPTLDLALLTLGDLRGGRFERPLASTWIGRKYLRAAATLA